MNAPTAPHDRVFLDANVLMAAAINPAGGARKLWELAGITLVTSLYAAREAWVNLNDLPDTDQLRQSLGLLLQRVELHDPPAIDPALFRRWTLPDPDDIPILEAAIAARCTHLLSGDAAAFGHLYGQSLDGVAILKTGTYLARRGLPKAPPGGR